MDNYVYWDGKNLAAIQMLTCGIPRRNGRPAAEVDADWNLRVLDVAVPFTYAVFADGEVLEG
jgi:hypothetical protein